MPQHRVYVEPFCGSAAVYWRMKPSEKEVLNDLDKTLMRDYRLLKNTNARNFRTDLNTISAIQSFVDKPATNDADKLSKTIAMRCNKFGSVDYEKGAIYLETNPYNKLRNIEKYQDRLKNTTLLSQDYASVIRRYDSKDTFFFLDPPYEDSKDLYKKGAFDHERLAKVLRNIKGKFILAMNDSSNVRRIFKGFRQTPIKVRGRGNFGVGVGFRNELLISNYKL
jgi:DNA adenine methylase